MREPVHPPAGTLRRRSRLAKAVADVLAPTWVMAALQLTIAVRSSPTLAAALGWSLVAPGGTTIIPWLFVNHGVRRGRYTDVHLVARAQRRVPLLVATVCVLAALAVLAAGGAPGALRAVVAAILVQLLVAVGVTVWWKVSVHAACVASAVTVWALALDPRWLGLAPLVGLVCWARTHGGDPEHAEDGQGVRPHTWPQALTGAVLGAGISAVVFPLLR